MSQVLVILLRWYELHVRGGCQAGQVTAHVHDVSVTEVQDQIGIFIDAPILNHKDELALPGYGHHDLELQNLWDQPEDANLVIIRRSTHRYGGQVTWRRQGRLEKERKRG